MHNRILSFLLISACFSYSFTPPKKPAAKSRVAWVKEWTGKWSGKSILTGIGDTSMKFGMTLEIRPIAGDSVYSWGITYEGQDKRDYRLVLKDRKNNRWAIDEGGGVLLDGHYFGGHFICLFSVGTGRYLLADYEKTAKSIRVSITTYDSDNSVLVSDDEKYPISSFPFSDIQFAELKKSK